MQKRASVETKVSEREMEGESRQRLISSRQGRREWEGECHEGQSVKWFVLLSYTSNCSRALATSAKAFAGETLLSKKCKYEMGHVDRVQGQSKTCWTWDVHSSSVQKNGLG